MTRFMFLCCLLCLLSSCMEQKKNTESTEQPVEMKDTMEVTPKVEEDSLVVVEEVIPVTADESFVDFFYNFASDEQFQQSRIIFPLPFYQENQVERFSKDNWTYDPLFSKEEVYTVMFDTEDEMELEKDTSAHSVQVDWICLDSLTTKRYYFERKQDAWYLEAINADQLKDYKGENEKFLDFYMRFVEDSVFQSERIHEPLLFVTADPEDEFQIVETTLEKGQWFAFRPPMPKTKLTNIRYGQTNVPNSPVKIIELKGFGNGFSNVLHFHCRQGVWKLVKFEDLSD